MSCCCTTTLGYAALVFLAFKLYHILRSIIYVHILAKRLGHGVNLSSYGKWAVVTGSTDGIGKGYAKELARRGLNVFLISRNQSKLEATAKEIKEQSNNVEVKTLAFDFGVNSTVSSYDVIKQALKGLEIGVLVNNVGISYDTANFFLDYPEGEKFWKTMIDVNSFSVVEMTHIILPQMVSRSKGVVINVASAAGNCPVPLLSVYAATKTFVSFFTQGLRSEYKDSGVIFQCVYPYFVATNMTKIKRANFFAPDPTYFAQAALNTVGLENDTNGCLSHAVQNVLLQLLPKCAYLALARKSNLALRDKVLRKAALKKE